MTEDERLWLDNIAKQPNRIRPNNQTELGQITKFD